MLSRNSVRRKICAKVGQQIHFRQARIVLHDGRGREIHPAECLHLKILVGGFQQLTKSPSTLCIILFSTTAASGCVSAIRFSSIRHPGSFDPPHLQTCHASPPDHRLIFLWQLRTPVASPREKANHRSIAISQYPSLHAFCSRSSAFGGLPLTLGQSRRRAEGRCHSETR